MLVDKLPQIAADVVAFDIETQGLDPHSDKILSFAVYDGEETYLVMDMETGGESIVALMNNPDILKVAHNAKFDLKFLHKQLENCWPANVYCTMMAEICLYNGFEAYGYALVDVLARYKGVFMDKDTRETFIGHEGPLTPEQIRYAEEDVIHLIDVYEQQSKKIVKDGLQNVVRLENLMLMPVAEMEIQGLVYDHDLYETYLPLIDTQLARIEGLVVPFVENFTEEVEHDITKKPGRVACASYIGLTVEEWEQDFMSMYPDELDTFRKVANYVKKEQPEMAVVRRVEKKYLNADGSLKINLNSVQQLNGLFDDLGIVIHNTAKDTVKEYIEDAKPLSDFLELLMEWRNWRKIRSWKYYEAVNPVTGRIHPDWKQIGTDTGRFSCSEPNVQQTPAPRNPEEPNLRNLFPAPDGYVYVVADYSQQEPRIVAQISGDKGMIRACNNEDVYIELGEPIFGRTIEKGSIERHMVKTGFLAAIYGAKPYRFWRENPTDQWEKHPGRLAQVWDIPPAEAEEIYNTMRRLYSKAFRWGDNLPNLVKSVGYTSTILGRRRYYDDMSDRKLRALANTIRNAPVQGTGADMLKIAVAKMYYEKVRRELNAHIAILVHDEIVVAVREDQAEEMKDLVVTSMESAGKDLLPDVFTPVEAEISRYWEK